MVVSMLGKLMLALPRWEKGVESQHHQLQVARSGWGTEAIFQGQITGSGLAGVRSQALLLSLCLTVPPNKSTKSLHHKQMSWSPTKPHPR